MCVAAVTGFGITGGEETAHFVCALVPAFPSTEHWTETADVETHATGRERSKQRNEIVFRRRFVRIIRGRENRSWNGLVGQQIPSLAFKLFVRQL